MENKSANENEVIAELKTPEKQKDLYQKQAVLPRYLVILSVFLGFVLFGIGGYLLGIRKGSEAKTQVSTPYVALTPIPTTTETLEYETPNEPTSSSTAEVVNGQVEFTYPEAGYSIKYPIEWSGGLQEVVYPQDFQNFHIQSPQYRVSTESLYEILEQGASLSVFVERTKHSTVDQVFENDPLASEIAFDKVNITINSLPAIQYDYDYEGHRATMTKLVKNNVIYTIKYRYKNDQTRPEHWETYINFLESFKLN